MQDGTRIAVDYHLPTAAGIEAKEPLPVILHYTRYIRAIEEEEEGAEGGDGKGYRVRGRLDSDPVLQHLSKHGYVVAVADSRGTGASFGVNNGAFSLEETRDGKEIIAWLAAQPWSNGNVGMHGRSYPGMTQYQAATQDPPALKAIFAEMAGPTAYDFVFRGGTYKDDFIEVWGKATRDQDLGNAGTPARVDADTDGSLRDAAIAEHEANLWAHELIGLPGSQYRNFADSRADGVHWSWETIGTIDDLEEIEKSGIAIYHLIGWYDIYTTQQPWLYASLEGVPQKMMIGPWVHSGGYGGAIHKAEILRWYDHWLKGVENGVMAEPPVHYYVMQGNHTLPEGGEKSSSYDEEKAEDPGTWTATREWPLPGAVREAYYLGAGPSQTVASKNDGTLVAERPSAGSDDYVVDYSAAMGSFSRWMNGYGARREQPERSTFFDERTAEDRKALTYTSAPLGEELRIVGYPTVHLWVESSHPDGDFFVYLEEIDAAGKAHYITEGALRASFRALTDAPWDNFGLPFHRGLPEDVSDLPDQPTELVFDLMGTAITIDAGHRIRVTVAGADARNHATHPDPSGKDAPTVTIHRGGEHASWVDLPVMNGADT
jgi:putative CocE/NonD family hydrolase